MPSPSLDAWHSSLGGRVHLSPCVSLHLSPIVSPPGCLARLSGWTRSFVSLGSLVSLCLPSFVSRCLPAWMIQSGWTGSFVSLCHLSPVVSQPGCLARLSGWTGSFVSLCLPSFVSQPGCLGFICLPLSPFICLPLSPSLDAWVDRFTCLLLSLPAWMPGTALWVDGFICLPLSPLISPVVSQPGCLARLSGWTGSFVSLCLPSFVSRCLPAWMPGAALWVDGFICLPLSPRMSGTPFVSLHLAPVVSQPGCLSRLSRRTDSLLSRGSPSFVSHLCGWTDSFVSLCLPLFVSRCLPAWMPLWVDGFICLPLSRFVCLPLSPSLDAWHGSLGGRIHLSPVVSQPGCVALTLRGFLHFPRFCPFGGVWFAFGFGPGFGHSLSCGCWGQGPPLSALHLDFDFAWARGGSSSLSIVGYTLSVRSVPRYQLRSRADDSGALRCAASATRRLC